jgi:hypothetical protein
VPHSTRHFQNSENSSSRVAVLSRVGRRVVKNGAVKNKKESSLIQRSSGPLSNVNQ